MAHRVVNWSDLAREGRSGDFPGGPVDKNPPAGAGRMSLIPGPGNNCFKVSCWFLP